MKEGSEFEIFLCHPQSSDKWSNLAQPDANNKKNSKVVFYSNQLFYPHKISNILEFFYFKD